MGTTTKTNQQTQFDPASMQQYQSFWSMASPILNSLIQNPYNNSQYNLNLAQATQSARGYGQQALTNSLSNLNTSGMGQSNSGVKAALMAQGNRYSSNLAYQGFQAAANQAQSSMWNSLGLQASRTPLVTGQNSTQSTSGLGTWLPQLAGAAIGGLTSVFTGGLSGLASNAAMGSAATASTPSSAFNAPLGSAGMMLPGQGMSSPFGAVPQAPSGGAGLSF